LLAWWPSHRGREASDPPLQGLKRDTLMAMIVIEMLTQGVYFDSRSVRKLPLVQSKVDRVFRALMRAGVIERSGSKRKYLLTDGFLDYLREEITRTMPRGKFIHHPDLSVFEICDIGNWSVEELDAYIKRLEDRWTLRKSGLAH
jgi:hypothetical protein